MGYICQAECKLDEAMDWWQKMLEYFPEDWVSEGECVDHILREIEKLKKMKK